ncbi:uncharacterized protein YneF (UPF0154 family) [Runella defluvii]|uniref:Uncharacterized protein YneF (UPF0154 family) n=1 Tax=Runella defluvii TaxID=370973 RepID=A0A7W6EPS8_9BACT|nr:pYEATS domain-containing protein [Runella defluvii]MBB3837646.1 uncharacterized protein YneF (UPF0154 family) [Runella defluvii]
MLQNLKLIFTPNTKDPFGARFTFSLMVFIAVGLLFIVCQGVALINITLLLAAACLVIGVLVGFLFGIPKFLQNNRAQPILNSTTYQYVPNTNLEEISDWLTKIIVGLGLVQLKSVPQQLQQTSEYIAPKIVKSAIDNEAAITLVNSLIIYFPIVGFIGGYLITRMYLSGAIRKADLELTDSNDLKEVLKNTQEAFFNVQTVINEIQAKSSQTEQGLLSLRGDDNNDPQKGQWGGLNERNGRRLSAIVKSSEGKEGLFDVFLKVESIDANLPLTGAVKFHLHPTFFNSNPIIFVQDGKAELKLVAWGAFTVGAETENGNTQLELDLADEKWGFPEAFRNQ